MPKEAFVLNPEALDTSEPKDVLIIGDFIVDKFVLPRTNKGLQKAKRDWQTHRQWITYEVDGGVCLLADMIGSFDLKTETLIPHGKQLESMALLENCKMDNDASLPLRFAPSETQEYRDKLKLRVKDNLGYRESEESVQEATQLPASPVPSRLIVLNDAGNDYRTDQPLLDHTQECLNAAKGEVILKMHLPLADGAIWDLFKSSKTDAKKLCIVHADDLRQAGADIHRGVTWDKTVEDLFRNANAAYSPLARLLQPGCTLVVMFGVEACAVFQPKEDGTHGLTFICDPTLEEGQVNRTLPGQMVGYMNAFISGYVAQTLAPDAPEFLDCIQEGMMTTRAFSHAYYVDRGSRIEVPSLQGLCDEMRGWIAREGHKIAVPKYIQIKPSRKTSVDLLSDRLTAIAQNPGESVAETRKALAMDIVLKGVRPCLQELPHGTIGALVTVDSAEIAALRAIGRLIDDYNDDLSRGKPISIAIFGPPGSGKSFGVKQLVDKDRNPVLEFNLSQATESDLPVMFQQVRDLNLKGKVPLCFFDEFDSGDCRLLKFFLGPMQDGEYRDGDAIRPLGRGIFAFAGGTASSFGAFTGDTIEDNKERAKFDAGARKVKLPDFISRLSGYLDVTGVGTPSRETRGAKRDRTQGVQTLHRAILLRSMLEKLLPNQVPKHGHAAMSPELIEWLIYGWTPVHGARSIETVIRGIAANQRSTRLGLSDVPPGVLSRIHAQ